MDNGYLVLVGCRTKAYPYCCFITLITPKILRDGHMYFQVCVCVCVGGGGGVSDGTLL